MKTFRLQEMEQYIIERGTATMDELRVKFNVSINTVRQDVATLCDKGSVKKIYGGVTSNQPNRLVPFEQRRQSAYDKKDAIGRYAAGLVRDGDIVFLDSGTTTMHIIEYIDPAKSIVLLTYNLNAINAAVPHENIEVICLPGKLDRNTNSFITSDTVKIMERYNPTIGFMAATGVTPEGGITNSSLLEYEIKRATVRKAARNVLLVDSGKFGRASLMTYATLDQMQLVVTDNEVDGALVEAWRGQGVQFEVVEP